jgi:hypothetical protein
MSERSRFFRGQSRARSLLLPKGAFFPNSETPRQRGTAVFEAWYAPYVVNLASYTAGGAITRDLIRLVIGVNGFPATLDRIAIEETAGTATAVARCALYSCVSGRNLYPSSLIQDSGELDCSSAGVKSSNISVAVGSVPICIATLGGVADATLRRRTTGGQNSLMGIAPTMGANHYNFASLSNAYGAFPQTFPDGAALGSTSNMPLVHVRYSQ